MNPETFSSGERTAEYQSAHEVQALVATAYERTINWAKAKGIQVRHDSLDRGKAGWFDGVTVTMNSLYGADERLFYLIHALGSIVIWSHGKESVQGMFEELREAKQRKEADGHRFEQALGHYRQFEIDSSCYAVGLLHDLECDALIQSYSNFMRADLESMTEFHRTGEAPVWRDFFRRWNLEVESGRRPIQPFEPRPIPRFQSLQIEEQEILQQQPR